MERFFSNPSNWDADAGGITLLSGPPCCGKTSLLFQFAVNRAAESGRGVVFLCSKERLESSPPFLSQGVDPSLSLLKRIQIKYIEDVDDIRKYFAAFHLLDDFPAAVIVDDFADFFSERVPAANREGFRSLVLLTVWEIWNERNRRVFRRRCTDVQGILHSITEQASAWGNAGNRGISMLLPLGQDGEDLGSQQPIVNSVVDFPFHVN